MRSFKTYHFLCIHDLGAQILGRLFSTQDNFVHACSLGVETLSVGIIWLLKFGLQ